MRSHPHILTSFGRMRPSIDEVSYPPTVLETTTGLPAAAHEGKIAERVGRNRRA